MPDGMSCNLYFFAACNDGMAGIVAALAAHDKISAPAKISMNLPLAFVAPLSAENNLAWHEVSFLSIWDVDLSVIHDKKYSMNHKGFNLFLHVFYVL